MAGSNKTIGYKIAETRVKADESQADLAAALGVKREMVTYWENGTRPIKAETIIEIAKRYNVSADYLLGLSDTPSVSEDMKTAVKVTGLTEKAIENARKFFSPTIAPDCDSQSFLSELIEQDEFCSIIIEILNYAGMVSILDGVYSRYVDKRLEDEDGLFDLYNLVRLEKYEIRDAFAANLEKLVPTVDLLSAVKKIEREHRSSSASSSNEGGEEYGGE